MNAPSKIKLWHGLNLTLLLSSLALIFGALTAIKWRFFFWTLDALPSSLRTLEPSRLYEKCIFALNYLAKRQTDLLQNGSLHHYITVVLFTMLLLAGGTLYLKWLPGPVLSAPRALPHEWSIAILITAAWVAIVFLRKLLAVIAALGAAGYGVALMFMLFGGADLAITQFAVETLSVILFVLVLYRLPGVSYYSSRGQRLFDFSIAACSGLLFTTLLIGATREKPFSGLSDFFLANALPLAHGRNVVNVIIVDFRALDTLGEISVLSIAAIGIFALLKLKNTADLNPSLSGTRPAHERYPSIILFAASRFLLPLLLLFSFFLLIRGHNEPGGGFVGGLTAAVAFTLHMLAHGVKETRRVLHIDPRRLFALGLAISLASALASVAERLPFFTGIWTSIKFPLIGPIGTPLIFDCGVFLIVLGVALLIFFSLAEES